MIRTLSVMAVGSLALASPSLAQNFNGNISNETVELMPFVGYRTGGSLSGQFENTVRDFGIKGNTSYGGVIDVNLHQNNLKIEALYSRQTTDIEGAGLLVPNGLDIGVEYLQGGILQESGSERGRFYISALLGATRFTPRGFDSATKFSTSLGGGLKLFPSPHVGLRFDARAFLTFVNGDSGGVCLNGICYFTWSGSHLWQGDFTAGLILAF
jgi:hypothetical protein